MLQVQEKNADLRRKGRALAKRAGEGIYTRQQGATSSLSPLEMSS